MSKKEVSNHTNLSEKEYVRERMISSLRPPNNFFVPQLPC